MASNLERVVINGTLLLNLMWPIGSIYSSTKSTDPGTIFGGTWTRIKGKTIVGVDENDATFKSVKSSGGEKTHTLTIAEMPSHNHTTQYSYCCSAVATNGGGSGWTHFTANNTSSGINYTGGGVLTTICLHIIRYICGSVPLKTVKSDLLKICKGGLV